MIGCEANPQEIRPENYRFRIKPETASPIFLSQYSMFIIDESLSIIWDILTLLYFGLLEKRDYVPESVIYRIRNKTNSPKTGRMRIHNSSSQTWDSLLGIHGNNWALICLHGSLGQPDSQTWIIKLKIFILAAIIALNSCCSKLVFYKITTECKNNQNDLKRSIREIGTKAM